MNILGILGSIIPAVKTAATAGKDATVKGKDVLQNNFGFITRHITSGKQWGAIGFIMAMHEMVVVNHPELLKTWIVSAFILEGVVLLGIAIEDAAGKIGGKK